MKTVQYNNNFMIACHGECSYVSGQHTSFTCMSKNMIIIGT